MKIALIQFPGSNCERETMLAIKRNGMEAVEFLWNQPIEQLDAMDGYVIVGGFSYEDRSRAGIISALDPVMQELKRQNECGKPILGICNGAQILVEAGLVPGVDGYQPAMAITENKRVIEGKLSGTGFYNAWVHVRVPSQVKNNAFTRYLSVGEILKIPAAHAQGRFVMSQALLEEIEEKGLNCFQYCDEGGQISPHFPVNPNGSMGNIAAVSNPAGNVMAMMPHPERTATADAIFRSMRDTIAEGQPSKIEPLRYQPTQSKLTPWSKNPKTVESLVELMITDNHALTVQNTLHRLGINVDVKRWVHWEIDCPSTVLIEQIKQSHVLFNDRKEFEYQPEPNTIDADNSLAILVRAKENIVGSQKRQMLRDHFSVDGVNQIQQGILWMFSCKDGNIRALSEQILTSNIISNPYANDCYEYTFTV